MAQTTHSILDQPDNTGMSPCSRGRRHILIRARASVTAEDHMRGTLKKDLKALASRLTAASAMLPEFNESAWSSAITSLASVQEFMYAAPFALMLYCGD